MMKTVILAMGLSLLCATWGEMFPNEIYDELNDVYICQGVKGETIGYCSVDHHTEAEIEPRVYKGDDKTMKWIAHYGFKAYVIGIGDDQYEFLHYAPKPKGCAKFPMVIYIPGFGQLGDLHRQFSERALFDSVLSKDFQKRHPCHLLAVSPPTNEYYFAGCEQHPSARTRWLHRLVHRMIKKAGNTVDLNRLYLTGFSWGGVAIEMLYLDYGNEFAGAVPIAEFWEQTRYVWEKSPGRWWYIMNDGDWPYDYPPEEVYAPMSEKIWKNGGEFRMSYYSAKGHDAWRQVWQEKSVWEWLFSQTMEKPYHPIKTFAADIKNEFNEVSFLGAHCSSTVPGITEKFGPRCVIDGLSSTAYMAKRPFSSNDWWQVELPMSTSGEVVLSSGDASGKNKMKGGCVEISLDGLEWVKGGFFAEKDGVCRFRSLTPFRFIRVVLGNSKCMNVSLRHLVVRRLHREK